LLELRAAYVTWFGEVKTWLDWIFTYGLKLEATGDPLKSTDSPDGSADTTKRLRSAVLQLELRDPVAARVSVVKRLSAVIGLGKMKKPTTSVEHRTFAKRLIDVSMARLTELEAFQAEVVAWFRERDVAVT
jgi:hypothetical protein